MNRNFTLLALLCLSFTGIHSQNCNTLGSGVMDDIRSFDVDTTTDILYAGGNINTAGGSPASHVVSWNGISWDTLGMSFNDHIDAVKLHDGDLWVSGDFTEAPGGVTAGYIAKYNGTSWSSPGVGMNNFVFALASTGDTLYAGGFFTAAGGSPANYIAGWDGSNWFNLGSGLNGTVNTLAYINGDLYAGGAFDSAGGNPANYIAKWDGNSWSALGAGTDYRVYSIQEYNGEIYAGGWFNSAGGVNSPNIAKWNGSSWSAVGGGLTGSFPFATSMAVYGGSLYVGGNFESAGTTTVNDIARWDGTNWYDVGGGVDGGIDEVRSLGTYRNELVVGGYFDTVGVTLPASRVARWTMLPPEGDFFANDTAGCESICINFYDQSLGGPTTFTWSFPGGTPSSSSDQHPFVCYSTPGVYNVQLAVSNGMGGDTLVKSTYITIYDTPDAMLSPGDTSLCPDEQLVFNASPDTSGYIYEWFMDNNLITGETGTTLQASTAGSYHVIISHPMGCTDTSAVSNLTYLQGPSIPVISINNNIMSVVSGNYTYQWFFNGTQIPGANSNTYTPINNGTYMVVITDTSGCTATSEGFLYEGASVTDLEKGKFNIYPNPAQSSVTLDLNHTNSLNAALVDITGRTVKSFVLNPGKNNLNLNTTPAGTYFIKADGINKAVKLTVIK